MADTEYPAVLKSRAEQIIEARLGRDIRDVLRDLYQDRGLTQEQIAVELGITRSTVVEWMKRHQIPTGYNRAEATA